MYFFHFCNTCLKSTWWIQFAQLLQDSHKAWPLLSPLFPHIKPSNKSLLTSYQPSKTVLATVLHLGKPYFYIYIYIIQSFVHTMFLVFRYFFIEEKYSLLFLPSEKKATSLNYQVRGGSGLPKHWSTQKSLSFLKKYFCTA